MKKCLICRKEFEEKGKHQKYCGSTDCWSKRNKFNSSPYINKKVFDNNRVIVLAKSKNRCSVCGDSICVYVHHIDRKRDNHAIDNLTPMCASCHSKLHHGGLGRPRKYNIQWKVNAKRIGVSYPTLIKYFYDRDKLKKSTIEKIDNFLKKSTDEK